MKSIVFVLAFFLTPSVQATSDEIRLFRLEMPLCQYSDEEQVRLLKFFEKYMQVTQNPQVWRLRAKDPLELSEYDQAGVCREIRQFFPDKFEQWACGDFAHRGDL